MAQSYETDILLKIDIAQAKKDLQAINDQIKTLNATTGNTEDQVKALERQWDLLSTTIEKAEKAQKEMDNEMKNTAKEAGNLKENLKDNNKALDEQADKGRKVGGIFSESVNAFRAAGGGIKGMTAAAKAFIATPIGAAITAIVAALGLLKKALSGSENGQKALAKATAVVKGAFDSLLQVVRSVGGLMVDFFTGNWTKLGDDLNGVKDAVKGIGGNMKQNAEIAEREFNLRKKESELQVQMAKNEAEIAKQRRISMDASKSAAEREAANAKVIELEKKNITDQIALAKEQLQLLKDKHALTDSTAEDLEEERDVEARIYNLMAEQERILQKTDKVQNSINKSTSGQKNDYEELVKKAQQYLNLINQIKVANIQSLDALQLQLMQLEADLESDPVEKAIKQREVYFAQMSFALTEEEKRSKEATDNATKNYDNLIEAQKKLGNDTTELENEKAKTLENIEAEHQLRTQVIRATYATQTLVQEGEQAEAEIAIEEKKYGKLRQMADDYFGFQNEKREATIDDYLNAAVQIGSILEQIAQIQDDGSKKSFEQQKKAQIANSLITGLAGAAGAYATTSGTIAAPAGPILGAIAAASVLASTAARIAAIKKQKYNAPNEGATSDTGSSTSSSAAASTGTSSVSRAIITRNLSSTVTDTAPKITPVLVVDEVTYQQQKTNEITRVSTI